MSLLFPTTYCDVSRGEFETEYGDSTDSVHVVLRSVPINVREMVRTVGTPKMDSRAYVIRTIEGRVPAGVQIERGDRLTTKEGRVLHVRAVTVSTALMMRGPTLLELEEMEV